MYFEADISCFWGQHPKYYSWDIEHFHGWWYNMGRERVARWQIHRIGSKHWEIVTLCWPLSALVPDPDKMVHTDSGRHQNWSKHKIVWNNHRASVDFIQIWQDSKGHRTLWGLHRSNRSLLTPEMCMCFCFNTCSGGLRSSKDQLLVSKDLWLPL